MAKKRMGTSRDECNSLCPPLFLCVKTGNVQSGCSANLTGVQYKSAGLLCNIPVQRIPSYDKTGTDLAAFYFLLFQQLIGSASSYAKFTANIVNC